MNFQKDDRPRLLPIAEFVYNNEKNLKTRYILSEPNNNYYAKASYKEIYNP